MRPSFALLKCESIYEPTNIEEEETILGDVGPAEDLLHRIQQLTQEMEKDPNKAQRLRELVEKKRGTDRSAVGTYEAGADSSAERQLVIKFAFRY